VAKLEKLLGRVDACQQRLEKIPALLKRFRQAVLAAACSGRLTADWREDDSYEDDLPAGWRWTPLHQLLPPGGLFDGPFGSNLKSCDYTESGMRVIRLENIGQLRFIGEKETFISREKYETLKKHTVGEGDIIFASFIADEVRACVLPKLSTETIAKADCFCLRPAPRTVDRQYFAFQLVSQQSYNTLFDAVHGATRPRINTTQLRKLEARVCPLPEQHEIARRVEALFALADQIEARLAAAQRQVDVLTPSLLARAFAGKLVSQDPTDEPAEKLLRRIREEGPRIARVTRTKRGRASP
jgi:type I restriction enzyme S subunit